METYTIAAIILIASGFSMWAGAGIGHYHGYKRGYNDSERKWVDSVEKIIDDLESIENGN